MSRCSLAGLLAYFLLAASQADLPASTHLGQSLPQTSVQPWLSSLSQRFSFELGHFQILRLSRQTDVTLVFLFFNIPGCSGGSSSESESAFYIKLKQEVVTKLHPGPSVGLMPG